MGKVLGGVTDAVGLTDYKGQKAAQAQAAAAQQASNKAADRSYEFSKEELEFQREQYGEWKDIYGDLQEELGDYYKNITGDSITNQQLAAIQKESQVAQEQIDTQLAQRGLSGSGLEATALMQNQFSTAEQKAKVRANSEQQAAQQKMGFLGLGLGQGTQMLGTQAQVSNTGASSQGSQAGSFLGSSVGFGNTAQAYSAKNINSSMAMAELAAAASDKRLKENIVLLNTIKGINFYKWTWNKLGNKLGNYGESFGVIAQEVQDIIPNSVVEKDGYLAVNYSIVLDYIGEEL